ncbi:MAG: ferrous iron transport protein B [Bacteroidales bacterium]
MNKSRLQTQLDKIVLHPFWGYPIFLGILFFIFQATFIIGEHPMNWIESAVELLALTIETNMSEGVLKDLIIDGVIAGVGGVIVFLPNIAILFFFISILQSSGYILRAAKLMDNAMHRVGMSGNSFIPLIMGFGCNVPAIMATETIKDRHSRIITILVNPLMSCSARLPVYLLLCAAFFQQNAGLVIFSIYLLGILLAILLAYLFRKFIVTDEDIDCEIYLTPYQMPSWKNTYNEISHQVNQYLKKMGGVILLASILTWFLGYFPKDHVREQATLEMVAEVDNRYNELIANNPENSQIFETTRDSITHILRTDFQRHIAENSYIGRIGKAIEPAVAPLGFNWKLSSSLLCGIAGKELIVSTMGVLYAGDDSGTTLIKALDRNNQDALTPPIALSFLVFVLIYFPCIPTITTIKSQTESIKWSIFTILYTSALAWIVAFITYRVSSLFF